MVPSESPFYIAGGTLHPDAPSYVERLADTDLFEGLMAGEFCYVLMSRQMGKSSLMSHTRARLQEAGVTAIVLDLATIGQNLAPEQWYGGLLTQIGEPLDLEDDLEEFWFGHDLLSPLQRWMAALREIVLAQTSGPIVLFVDEIDTVRSLPFSTDEFFAAIRACYNRRIEDARFNRLTFCLLGVASPSDLIQDARTTPFNIGRRIELTDFTEAEVAPLAAGLGREEPAAKALLKRVLYWTGGHPYLTQLLCQTIAGDTSILDAAGVDRLSGALFFSPRARERDANLLFVRESLLRSEGDLASVLDLYGRVRQGAGVPDDETSPLVSIVRLSGVTRSVEGRLRVRNRIYERVFGREWIAENMPDAELRRQRAAYRRGLARAGLVGGAVMVAMTILAAAALFQAHRADEQHRLADRQRQAADEGKRATRRLLYAADIGLAQEAWEKGHTKQALGLLAAYVPKRGEEEDLRSFEWRYLEALCRRDFARYVFPRHEGPVGSVAWSPDGKLLATGDWTHSARLWDVATRRLAATLQPPTGVIGLVAFSPSGRLLATGGRDRIVRLWDLASKRQAGELRGATGDLDFLVFSPDGRLIAAGGGDNTVEVWRVASQRKIHDLKRHTSRVEAAAFSPDGKLLATAGWDGMVKLWDTAAWREVASLEVKEAYVSSLAFSPDGAILIVGIEDGTLKRWDVRTRSVLDVRQGHDVAIESVAFSPDGHTLATASDDQTVKLWDSRAMREETTLRGHTDRVQSVAFSPDGRRLATGSADRTARLWDVASAPDEDVLAGHRDWVNALAFSPDGKTLATGSFDRSIKLWDVTTRRLKRTLTGHRWPITGLAYSPDGRTIATVSSENWFEKPNGSGELKLWNSVDGRGTTLQAGPGRSGYAVAFSPDGRTLATGQNDPTVKLWDIASRRQIAALCGHSGPVHSMAFSPDGRRLATGSSSGGPATLWDLATMKPRASLGKPGDAFSLSFAPDGEILAIGTPDGSIKLFDGHTGSPRSVLHGVNPGDGAVAFSRDEKTVALANDNGTVTLWNRASGRQTLTLRGFKGFLHAAVFSPDGTILAAGGADRTVRLYRGPRAAPVRP